MIFIPLLFIIIPHSFPLLYIEKENFEEFRYPSLDNL